MVIQFNVSLSSKLGVHYSSTLCINRHIDTALKKPITVLDFTKRNNILSFSLLRIASVSYLFHCDSIYT